MRKIIAFLSLCFFIPFASFAVTSSITSNFNGTPIEAGDVIWFTASIKLTGSLPTGPVNIYMVNGNITSSYFNIAVPNGQISYDPGNSSANTIYSGSQWITNTTAPNTTSTFLAGTSFVVPTGGLPGGINPVTWTASFTTNTPDVSLNWQWAAAVYSGADFSNLNTIGVWSTNSQGLQPGTPTNEESFVVGGARGGGGSNYTGSFSGTSSVNPNIAAPEPSVYLLLGSMLIAAYCFSKNRRTQKSKQE